MNDALLRLVLMAIAVITVLTGAAQLIAGPATLGVVAKSADPLAVHLFGTVGMFMVITGAMFLQTLIVRSREAAVPLWIAVQKCAAAVLVFSAWHSGLFTAIALLVAGFDALTGILALIFWRRMQT